MKTIQKVLLARACMVRWLSSGLCLTAGRENAQSGCTILKAGSSRQAADILGFANYFCRCQAEATGRDVVYIRRYHDKLVREDGEWKFKERVVAGDVMYTNTVKSLNAAE